MVKIAPSILSADFAILGEQVSKVEQAGAELLHIDVMDGHFVPNITIGPLVVEALRPVSQLIFDVHLMIENPDLYIKQFARAGADIITVHAETCPHLHRTVQAIKETGVKAGVALNPSTPPDILEYVLGQLDLVLVMTVNPGFGGQKFIREMLPKISKIKAMLDRIQSTALLEVDGGVNVNTAGEVAAAGADTLVAGSAIFGAEDPAVAVQKIKEAAGEKNL
ncbi:ribulose-5-phosphate 3-epimerase [Desulfotomaculum arcticum]|uniref:Ribulose-phosphate 3-epimerase n=1 Tax=Desulfotruncus arcticus DSM 17038 TaxID=1121424 RepID=A0A1I2RA70_9FIRM|nr:ribulose-phosphate 3-epimerase [Desulfotruncus arcticus]SFG36943.1 ribulose-5-phosphate 3-epimerase [Desulfotomaculum arcticum] [Desulfotruncus arcticus DSM 17038]